MKGKTPFIKTDNHAIDPDWSKLRKNTVSVTSSAIYEEKEMSNDFSSAPYLYQQSALRQSGI